MKEQEAFIPTMLALDRRRVAGGEKPRRIHGIFLVCAVLLFSLGLTACSSSGVASNLDYSRDSGMRLPVSA